MFAIFAFAILYWLLNKYAFGPLFGIMEKRAELVQEQLKSAETNRTQAEQLVAEQKEAIQEARKDAYNIVEQAKQASTRQAEEIVHKAKEDASRIKEEAVRDIESEKNKAIAALREQVGDMSVLIASKVLEKEVDAGEQQKLVNQYLKEVEGDKYEQ
ncbi:F0F1 ATP synthase subunit B-like protein [Paenibacillus larvae subsp. larvae B-3650]|nr:F0F1 ATP synthase subunit B-like protein [Paenibacillus larvae subsp. larvae B-3650]